jgi:hypothetical protein
MYDDGYKNIVNIDVSLFYDTTTGVATDGFLRCTVFSSCDRAHG